YGADEFINNRERWCLWLGDCSPSELRAMPETMKRVEAERAIRLASRRAPTQRTADTPTRFHVENMPHGPYLLVPRVSSERRKFIPIGFISPDCLTSDSCLLVPNATLFHFGVMTSTMHNAWMRTVCGRLKSDYRYSASIVYNNFPWPDASDKQRDRIEEAAQGILDARAAHPDATMADLYDPLTMPPNLTKAHAVLDRTVDAAYKYSAKALDAARVAFLLSIGTQQCEEA